MYRQNKKEIYNNIINYIKQTGASERQACIRFNIPKSTFFDWKQILNDNSVQKNVVQKNDSDISSIDPVEYGQYLLNQRNESEQLKRLRIEKEKLIIALDNANKKLNFKEFILENNPKTISINSTTKTRECAIISMLSDWHIDETIEPSVVTNLNEYNPEIASRRIKKLFNKILEYIKTVEATSNISVVVLAALGDFISGYIHEELEESNSISPTQGILLFRDLFSSGINYILNNTKYNVLVACCYGNHSRTQKDYRVSTAHQNSYEWLIYNIMAKDYKSSDRVKFIISDGAHLYLDIFDNNIRFHHGDGIRGGGGDSGIYPPVNRAIRDWDRSIKADMTLFGHFHQEAYGRNWICNGSAIGWNAFAVSIRAQYDVPKQIIFTLDKEEGRKLITPIVLL